MERESGEREKQKQKISRIAGEILDSGKTQLLLNLRFLSPAVGRLTPEETEETGFATDGKSLFYHPRKLLLEYRTEPSFALRIWLHPLMHCLFLHMFIQRTVDHGLWDLACDMAAEGLIASLHLEGLKDPEQRLREQELQKLRRLVSPLTAEKIYRYLLDDPPGGTLLLQWQQLFGVDSHRLWYEMGKEKGNGSHKGRSKNREQEQEESLDGTGEDGKIPPDATLACWKHVSQQMKVDLETFSKAQGEQAGDFLRALCELKRERCDYQRFLRRFAARCEVMKVSPDEFDYIFYMYGIELYRDMPLIEPLEYREDKRIRELAVVIDTSGSVQGDMVQMFLQKTFAIVKQQEAFDRRFCLHIIQCDAKVQQDAVIHSQEDFDRFLETAQFQGFGGTDFRPAFAYVNRLCKEGAFHDLRGLLYFTDGQGKYPETMPDYQTAFVFVNRDSLAYARVPSWAIRVYLDRSDLEF